MTVADDNFYRLNYVRDHYKAGHAGRFEDTVLDAEADPAPKAVTAANKTIKQRRNAAYQKFLAGTLQFDGVFVKNRPPN